MFIRGDNMKPLTSVGWIGARSTWGSQSPVIINFGEMWLTKEQASEGVNEGSFDQVAALSLYPFIPALWELSLNLVLQKR